ncbi:MULTISPECIES: tripartite tricarboxylate transporter TctB family protein [Thalassospira]|uniref:Tripartite tricarboxylate transporter TctB family protein n=1 Tax=Thalassospira povalilytica TaxID=732237 RepID=A0A8I1SFQ0_9PROT|nr:tripartite tricarboxylate transporter TctB family protein [Thalassospira povalilytica]MBN8195022.1 tripartite tricarboxylate transporter TctB family protein [Thalassospira povalilytica]
MNQNRDFYAGLLATAFFAIVLFVLIPIYVKVPSFIPGFAPPPDMWPRVVAIIGLVMGVLAVILAFPKMREASRNQVTGLGTRIMSHKTLIVRFAAVLVVFAAFVIGMPIVGFVPATILMLGVLFIMTGNFERKFWMIGLTVIFPVLLYLLFTEVTHTPFPEGTLFF